MLSRPPASLASRDQRVAGLVEVVVLDEGRLDPLLGDHRGEAVAAQQDHVAGARRVGPGVDLDVRLEARARG